MGCSRWRAGLPLARVALFVLLVLGGVAPNLVMASTPEATEMAAVDGARSVSTDASAAPDLMAVSANVVVEVDRATPAGTSQMAVGVTHTQHSADYWNSAAAVGAARQMLRASAVYQNQHIMGWGADNPEPSPGIYDWRSLDERIGLVRQTEGVAVITLCCAPDWMKGGVPGTTDWSQLERAPLPSHYGDFAELAKQVAARYPDVQYFQVWNELKGFWNTTRNRWDYEGYLALYNQVYEAVKSVRPDAKIGGPYVVIDSWSDPRQMSHPSSVRGPYGTLDQRPLDVIDHWLEHKRGADFVTVDAWTSNKDGVALTDEFTATQKFADVVGWIRQRTDLPIWWAEWYATPWDGDEWEHTHQNAVMATALIQMARSGVAVSLRWQPQGERGMPYEGNTESLWSDTRVAGGGQPFPFFYTQRAFKQHFGAGVPLHQASVSSPDVEVLASAAHTLLVNKRAEAVVMSVNGEAVLLDAHEVRLI